MRIINMRKTNPPGQERRKYIRLDSVFPVQFRLFSCDGKNSLSDWLQGFTNNISKGGICLSINNLKPELAELIKNKEVKFSLAIEMPLAKKETQALAYVSWVEESFGEFNKYLIGLSYENILKNQNATIVRYARMKRAFLPVTFSIIGLLLIAFIINSAFNARLIQGNKALVEQLVKVLEESSLAKQKLSQISTEKEDLRLGIQGLQSRIKKIEEEKLGLEKQAEREEEKLKSVSEETNKKISGLTALIGQLSREKVSLEEKLIATKAREDVVGAELLRLDEKQVVLQEENFNKMYQWLKIHQNPRTGLGMSFEGDNDVSGWAFSYDQSLLIQAYTLFADFQRAQKILDFFSKKAKRSGMLFYNAYYAAEGIPVEYVVHSGPNIWLGIAALHYTEKSGDRAYLKIAEEIAQGIIGLQNQDRDGGIRGGPKDNWFATEHNLDAYAFFNMLDKVTAKEKYAQARDKALAWLLAHTYDKLDIPIIRGKGDSTIATDTYAWSIASIGPEKLESLGLNPGKIIEFAEENCRAQVSYLRPDGKSVQVKGFDFAPQKHVARGGVVSSEWTAQMTVAFELMADFYRKKNMLNEADIYEKKADEALLQLTNMLISSPSPSGQGEGCLPYATQDFVDTGHGWRTPKGKATGSVAGTAYALFAYYKYNPLSLRATEGRE